MGRQQRAEGQQGATGSEPSGMCVICWDSISAVGLQHGDTVHLCLCSGCADLVGPGQACPMCNQPVAAKFKVFMS